MRYSIEYEGDILVATVKSPWVNEPDSGNIHEDIKAELERGARRLLIDLEHCRFSTSGGIGVCVAISTSMEKIDGIMKLGAVNDRVRRSFVVAGVWQLFDMRTYDTKSEAMQAFREEARHLGPEESHI